MKLTLKTLSRDTFEVEIDENLTVCDLKKKIEEVRGASYAAPTLKLIYAGKILSDEKVLKEYDISAFIVVMVSKPKPAPSPESATSSVAAPAPDPAAPPTATPAAPTQPPSTAPTQPPSTAPATTPSEAPATTPSEAPAATPSEAPATTPSDSMLVSGPEYQTAVAEMEAMGFQREQIERAMTASFMNPHRAVAYLFNPSAMPTIAVAQQPAEQQPAEQPATPAATTEPAGTPGAPPPAAGSLDFLRNQPQFQMMRQMIEQNPQMLETILSELGVANPQLLQAIQHNPQQFIDLLQEGGGGGDVATPPAAAPPSGHGPTTVPVTPAEKEAIDRIKALGFPEHLVIQAYFACDKNENLAAEFLYSENFQDD